MGKSLKCPGFWFKPTDVQLVMYFLKRKLLGKKLALEVIAEINIYDFSTWDLPAKSILNGDLECIDGFADDDNWDAYFIADDDYSNAFNTIDDFWNFQED
ncbi:hypothetical protein L2E82_39657 [Cichorium intybus]|uniref:Uncharacterized protein n=1 Tax=Cichorium intybus TaxID=13427 RepID=A0ACB9AI44_CICIN|nr:hypothetical protein L2E82_39657 [Cichorium intybus]